MTAAEYSKIAIKIPINPGIYKYYNEAGQLIYVGKAKHLRKRISSYFTKQLSNQKTIELVQRIHQIEFTIVNSEEDAFLLENTLIKKYQPFYNINLKDDKTYPYLVIKNEPFPRVFFSRRKLNDQAEYFGPYATVGKVWDMLEFIKQHIPLRNCKLNLSEKNIQQNKFKVCLEYHLGNCKGPCEGFQTLADYEDGIEQLRSLLKGNLFPLLQHFKKLIQLHSEALEFEKAAYYQQKIAALLQYQAKSIVVNTKTGTVDVFTMIEEGDRAFVNYLAVSNGSIILTKTITLEKKLEEAKEDILAFAISHLRQLFKSEAKEIIIPYKIEYFEKNILQTIPQLGDKKKLLDLSQINVNHFKVELEAKKMLHLEDKTAAEKQTILLELQNDLKLSAIPYHIECFDNSNLQGTNAVAAMVCFKNGQPSKKEYRNFNIKTVEGINDFASMKEVVYRRYKRLLEERAALPQLIIIDGGKGQLSAALESIVSLNLSGKITLVGLAKNQEELFFANDSISIKLPWNSESLKLIRRIRDEVHRLGISHHRNKRSRAAFENELEKIEGIGQKTMMVLMKEFRSVKKIKTLELADLEKVIGKSKALIVFSAFHK